MLNINDGQIVLSHLLCRMSGHVVLPKSHVLPDSFNPRSPHALNWVANSGQNNRSNLSIAHHYLVLGEGVVADVAVAADARALADVGGFDPRRLAYIGSECRGLFFS
jgi:hypothetical protein